MFVLIVEDDALIGMDLRDELMAAGYHVAGPAAEVEEALSLAEDLRPEVAVVDIDLHGGNEGLELARQLRRKFGVATVFVSGERAAALANTDAAFGYLPKPYAPRDVIAAIEVVSELGHGRRPPAPSIPKSLELFGG
jgi:DNA-binding response OmpR family regulator